MNSTSEILEHAMEDPDRRHVTRADLDAAFEAATRRIGRQIILGAAFLSLFSVLVSLA